MSRTASGGAQGVRTTALATVERRTAGVAIRSGLLPPGVHRPNFPVTPAVPATLADAIPGRPPREPVRSRGEPLGPASHEAAGTATLRTTRYVLLFPGSAEDDWWSANDVSSELLT